MRPLLILAKARVIASATPVNLPLRQIILTRSNFVKPMKLAGVEFHATSMCGSLPKSSHVPAWQTHS